MSSDIRDILHRLTALEEAQTTPVSVKHGLNKQQKKADQLPALFKPKNISPTLTKAPYQDHPMKGKLVGGESAEPKKNALEEAMQDIEEDMLSKVKKKFADYLERLEDDNKIDGKLVRKAKAELNIDDDPQTEEADEPTWDPDVAAPNDPDDTETAHGLEDQIATAVSQPTQPLGEGPVSVYEMGDGTCLECWGDDQRGYEIRRGDRVLPTRFKSPGEAEVAVKLFQRKRKQNQDLSQDYIEER